MWKIEIYAKSIENAKTPAERWTQRLAGKLLCDDSGNDISFWLLYHIITVYENNEKQNVESTLSTFQKFSFIK